MDCLAYIFLHATQFLCLFFISLYLLAKLQPWFTPTLQLFHICTIQLNVAYKEHTICDVLILNSWQKTFSRLSALPGRAALFTSSVHSPSSERTITPFLSFLRPTSALTHYSQPCFLLHRANEANWKRIPVGFDHQIYDPTCIYTMCSPSFCNLSEKSLLLPKAD